jgi:hypothetical protein
MKVDGIAQTSALLDVIIEEHNNNDKYLKKRTQITSRNECDHSVEKDFVLEIFF